jgi:hypothetical protein
VATCGECGRQWDDSVITSLTPAPAARCPYEYIHGMTSYTIDVTQMITVSVTVMAGSEDDALAEVDKVGFPLPPRDQWSSVKGSFEYELVEGDGALAGYAGDENEGEDDEQRDAITEAQYEHQYPGYVTDPGEDES